MNKKEIIGLKMGDELICNKSKGPLKKGVKYKTCRVRKLTSYYHTGGDAIPYSYYTLDVEDENRVYYDVDYTIFSLKG